MIINYEIIKNQVKYYKKNKERSKNDYAKQGKLQYTLIT